MRFSCRAALSTPASTTTLRTVPARAPKQHDPGASDTGIRIGSDTVPYSGQSSAFDVFAPCARYAAAHTRAGAGRRPRGAGAGAA